MGRNAGPKLVPETHRGYVDPAPLVNQIRPFPEMRLAGLSSLKPTFPF